MKELTRHQQAYRFTKAVVKKLTDSKVGITPFTLERIIGLQVPVLDDDLLHPDSVSAAEPELEMRRWKQFHSICIKVFGLLLRLFILKIQTKEVYQPSLAPYKVTTYHLTAWGRLFGRLPEWCQTSILFLTSWVVTLFGFMRQYRFLLFCISMAYSAVIWIYANFAHYWAIAVSVFVLLLLVIFIILGHEPFADND